MFGVSMLVRTCCGTLYPCYASFKAVKSNDVAQLEKWVMFWTVMGCVTVAETTAEWLVNWLPFYYQAKTVVILWLTLPQIQGSTFVYVTYLHPFLLSHEKDIDAALVEARARARQAGLGYIKRAYAALRELVASAAGAAIAADVQETQAQQPTTLAPPTLADPASGPAHQALSYAGSLMRAYGPAALAAGSALLHPMQGRGPALASGSSTSSAASTVHQRSVARRRSELERELAELSSSSSSPPDSRTPSPPLMPIAESFVGGQRFEEITAEEARVLAQAEKRVASGWWFRPYSSPAKAKAE